MKTTLKLECIGDDVDQTLRHWKKVTSQLCGKNIAEATFGKMPHSYFVAEIIGFHPKYKYERKFLGFQKDYKNANSKGSRDIYAYYILEEGKIYDVKEPYSWGNHHRYFCTVDEKGNIKILTKEEVDQWLKNH
jgi:hypothetical protein